MSNKQRMKLRTAKKIVTRWHTSGMTQPLRRDLVIRAHRKLGLDRPEFQEPETAAIQPKVVPARTSENTEANTAGGVAAISLTTPNETLTTLKVSQLKALCKEHGIKGYSKLTRDGLIETLQARGA